MSDLGPVFNLILGFFICKMGMNTAATLWGNGEVPCDGSCGFFQTRAAPVVSAENPGRCCTGLPLGSHVKLGQGVQDFKEVGPGGLQFRGDGVKSRKH